MIYQAEKQLKELSDKVPADLKSRVEAKVENLKSAAKGEDVNTIKQAQEGLQQELMQIGQAIYGSGGQGSGSAQPGAGAGPSSGASNAGGDDPEVLDADFTDSS